MSIRPTVRVHAALAELPAAIKLWYLLRLLDGSGCGRVRTTIASLSQEMGLSVPTIKRYLRQGREMGLYRSIVKQWGKEEITIYLSSLFDVCLRFGIDNWGACTDVRADELRHMRAFTTQATAQRVQRHSRYLAKKQHKVAASAANIIDPSSCKVRGRKRVEIPGSIVKREHRFVFATEDYPCFGGSQAKISETICRSERTICRRLSNASRMKRGLPALDRIQLLKRAGTVKDAATFQCLVASGFRGVMGTNNPDGGIDIWEFTTNVYAEDLKLYSQKQLKSKFAHLRPGQGVSSLPFELGDSQNPIVQHSYVGHN